jgi:diadenosine tetraphosphate (Ap4A) HIT family hydrolase
MSDSAPLPPWEDLMAGRNCPLCRPREDSNAFSVKVAKLSVSTLYLDRNQVYRGYAILVFGGRHVTGIEHLTAQEYQDYMNDLRRAAQAISKTVSPDLMNYASLGNVVPHLHFHLIPRYRTDPRWGAPVWPSKLADMPRREPPEEELKALAAAIAENL